MTTRFIICDGMVGAGKSTTADFLAHYLRFNRVPAKLSGEDGSLRIHALHRPPRASIPPEYLPGEPLDSSLKVKLKPEAFVEESLKRWSALAQEMDSSDDVLVADGHMFHGAADQLHLLDASHQLIEEYIAQIFRIIHEFDPILVHLMRHDTERTLRETCQARGPVWTRHQVAWKVCSPYGRRKHYQGFEGLVRLFSDFSRVLERTTNNLPHRVIRAEVSSGSYIDCYNAVLQYLRLPSHKSLGVAGFTNKSRDVVLMGEADSVASLARQDMIGNLYVRVCSAPDALKPLHILTKIDGHLYLISNSGFHHLAALSKLHTVGGGIIYYGNRNLASLDFISLEQFSGTLVVMGNPDLQRIENVGSPEQLESLQLVTNGSLLGFSGLRTLQSVRGTLRYPPTNT